MPARGEPLLAAAGRQLLERSWRAAKRVSSSMCVSRRRRAWNVRSESVQMWRYSVEAVLASRMRDEEPGPLKACCVGVCRCQHLLIRPDDNLNSVRAEPVKALRQENG